MASEHASDPLSSFRLDGRTAIVTGVGPGIGAHAALAVPTDVGRAADLEHLVVEANRAFGGVDVVFNNAHVNPAWTAQTALEHGHARGHRPDKGPFDYSAGDWQSCLDVNVLAPYRLAQAGGWPRA